MPGGGLCAPGHPFLAETPTKRCGHTHEPRTGSQGASPTLTAEGTVRSRTPEPLISCPSSSLAPWHGCFPETGAHSCPDSLPVLLNFQPSLCAGLPWEGRRHGGAEDGRASRFTCLLMPAHLSPSAGDARPPQRSMVPRRKILPIPKAIQIL